MSTRRNCCNCYTPKSCGANPGAWNTVSGTWSTGTTNYQYATCSTSSGQIMYTPTSGIEPGDRVSVRSTLSGGASNAVYGFIFDAIDDANYHRIRFTVTGGNVEAIALEKVTAGTVAVIDERVHSFGTPGSLGEVTFSERGAYVYSGNPLFLFLPRTGDYAKLGGTKFGLFVDSHDGASIGFQSTSEPGFFTAYFFGQNTCGGAHEFTPCVHENFNEPVNAWLARQGISVSQVSTEIAVNSFAPNDSTWYRSCKPQGTYDQAWWFPTTVLDYQAPGFGTGEVYALVKDAPFINGGGFMDCCEFFYEHPACYSQTDEGDTVANSQKLFFHTVGITNAATWLNEEGTYPLGREYDLPQKMWRVRFHRVTNWQAGGGSFGEPGYLNQTWKSDPVSLVDMEPGKTVHCKYEGKTSGYANAETTIPYHATLGDAFVTFL